jgi:ATP-dependent phosphoenolpyruvate carboxykinase
MNLAEDLEPDIYCTVCANSLLKNVIPNDDDGTPSDYSDTSTTENGRVPHPIYRVLNYVSVVAPALKKVDSSLKKMINGLTLFSFVFAAQGTNVGTSQKHQFSFLRCLCSVLPPAAKLSLGQAMYHFLLVRPVMVLKGGGG